jgi:hypothetical protein
MIHNDEDDELDPATRRKVVELEKDINKLFAGKALNIIMLALLETTAFAFAAMSAEERHIDDYVYLLREHLKMIGPQVKPFARKQ